jgi:O-acetyl-ADP-ribose deacetylase (regulator of RNase III)
MTLSRPHPILALRRRRWSRAERQAAEVEARSKIKDLRRYRSPVQVCPRGCGYHEMARRDLRMHTAKWGRSEVIAEFVFETRNCPECGAPLAKKCARCKQENLAPVVDLCRSCGLPQPWAAERREGAERSAIRLWRPESKKKRKKKTKVEMRVNDPARRLYRYATEKKRKGKRKRRKTKRGDVWVIEGDIVQLDVHAVVSNDDVDGQMWAQVARSIKKAAGEGVERLAQEGKPFKLGDAWVTTPGNLQQMKNIVHVASMNRQGETSEDTVEKSLASALELAVRKGHKSIALACFGIATIGRNRWFEIFAETTVAFYGDPGNFKKRKDRLAIVLVLFEPAEKFEEEVETLEQMLHAAWVRAGEPASGKPEWQPTAGETSGEVAISR